METGGRVGGTCFGPAVSCDWRHVGARECCNGDHCTLQTRSERKKTGRRTGPVGGCLERHSLDLPIREHTGIIKRRNREAQRG